MWLLTLVGGAEPVGALLVGPAGDEMMEALPCIPESRGPCRHQVDDGSCLGNWLQNANERPPSWSLMVSGAGVMFGWGARAHRERGR